MLPGYWHANYWPAGYWPTGNQYWQHWLYVPPVPTPGGGFSFRQWLDTIEDDDDFFLMSESPRSF